MTPRIFVSVNAFISVFSICFTSFEEKKTLLLQTPTDAYVSLLCCAWNMRNLLQRGVTQTFPSTITQIKVKSDIVIT